MKFIADYLSEIFNAKIGNVELHFCQLSWYNSFQPSGEPVDIEVQQGVMQITLEFDVFCSSELPEVKGLYFIKREQDRYYFQCLYSDTTNKIIQHMLGK